MTVLFANNATSRLTIATAAASTTITLPSGEGGRFPAITAPDYFLVTIEDRRTNQMEICKCTARSTDVLTVVRGQEGTVAQDFLVGATVSNRMTAGTLAVLQEAYLKSEADALFVDVAGDTMSGPLVLSGNPTAGPQAANKAYVDAQVATRAPTVHTHVIADVTGLTAALAAKEAVAPTDGSFYGRMGAAWIVPAVANITGLQAALDAKLGDAPSDGVTYGRRNATWQATALDWASITGKPSTFPPTVPIQQLDVLNLVGDLATKVPEAPMTGSQYARASGAWVVVSGGGGGGIPEAPTDGQLYGRKNSGWFIVPATPTWSTLTGKPATFPPTLPIAQSDVTGLVAGQTAQDNTISGKEPLIAAGTVNDFWRGDKSWQPLSGITVDAYTKVQADARFAPIVHTHAIADVTGLTSALAGKEPTITGGTTAQYWRGDKSWQTLPAAGIADAPSDGNIYGRKNAAWATVAANVAVSLTPPSSPRNGDLWWKSDVCLLYCYYDDGNTQQWVVTSPNQDVASLDARYLQVANGIPGVFKVASGSLVANAASFDVALPVGYSFFDLMISNMTVTIATSVVMYMSNDGTTFPAAATDIVTAYNITNNSGANVPTGGSNPYGLLCASLVSNTGNRALFKLTIPVNIAGSLVPILFDGYYMSGTAYDRASGFMMHGQLGGPLKALRFASGAGMFASGLTWQLNGWK